MVFPCASPSLPPERTHVGPASVSAVCTGKPHVSSDISNKSVDSRRTSIVFAGTARIRCEILRVAFVGTPLWTTYPSIQEKCRLWKVAHLLIHIMLETAMRRSRVHSLRQGAGVGILRMILVCLTA